MKETYSSTLQQARGFAMILLRFSTQRFFLKRSAVFKMSLSRMELKPCGLVCKNFERRTCGTVAPKSANPCFKKNIKSRSGENTCALKLLAAYYYVPDDVKNAIAPILENKTRNTEELPLAVTWKRRSWN